MKTKTELIKFNQGLDLESGARLNSFDLMVETYGELNEDKDNAILVCHAFSGNHHAAGKSSDSDALGWWDEIIGSGKAIDTDKFFVVCSNNLGGCSGSSGPLSVNPESGKLYGKDFPLVTVTDWVNSQKLLCDHLGISKWHMVAGGSLGGMQALQWAISYPNKVKKAGVFATATRSSTQNIAMNEVGREAIRKDKNFMDGDYLNHNLKPKNGLKTARMLGHITYSSEDIMDQKFGRKFQDIKSKIEGTVDYEVENYLQYKGEKFSDTFDANSYITLSTAVDYFDIGQNIEQITKTLEKSTCKWLVISFSSDWLYPPYQSEEIVNSLINLDRSVSYSCIKSKAGHDAFLLERDYGKLSSSFLENISGSSSTKKTNNISRSSTNIFFDERVDLKFITNLVNKNDRVLDLGCEDGTLLYELKEKGCSKLVGVEIDGDPIEKVPENFWPVFDVNNKKIGRLSRCFFSPRLKKNIGLAIIDINYTEPETALIIESPKALF